MLLFEKVVSKFSLRVTLISLTIIPLLITIGIFTYIGLEALSNSIEERMQKQVELVARAIREPVSYSMQRESIGGIAQALESVFRTGQVYGASVYNVHGERVAAVGAIANSSVSFDAAEVLLGKKGSGLYEYIRGEKVFSYFVPLFDEAGQRIGFLQVSRQKSDIYNYIESVHIQAISFLIIVSMIMIGIVLFGFNESVEKYLNNISDVMTRVMRGEFSLRTKNQGPKEIYNLCVSLNSMLDSISEAEIEISKRKSDQKALENKLRQSEKMAAIGQLASGVAHELGTPLSVIDGKAQRLLRKYIIDEKIALIIKDIRYEVKRMESIVRQLLDFGRSHRQHRRWINMSNLVYSASTLVSQEINTNKEIQFNKPDSDYEIYVDPMRMEQVLINLIKNSLQVENVTKVKITWYKQDDYSIYIIEDDGEGINKDEKDKIFEPFYSTKNVGEGSGLGLSVVHGIIKDHNGEIYVTDSVLGGACFTIQLPDENQNN